MHVKLPNLVVAFAAILLTATAASASLVGTASYSTAGNGGDEYDAFDGDDLSLGFEFTPTVNIDVTALGYYNGVGAPDVLAGNHNVAIYYSQNYDGHVPGEVAVSALVLTTDADLGAYTYSDLSASPVRLFAGVTYRIAGAANEDDDDDLDTVDGWHRVDNGASHIGGGDPKIFIDPMIQLLVTGYYNNTAGSAVAYPITPSSTFYAPANFLFVEAPEPASLGLLCLGGLSLFARRRRSN